MNPQKNPIIMAPKLSDNLEAMWAALLPLTADSPDSAFEAWAAFYEPDAAMYFRGVANPPTVGREAIIATIKGMFSFWAILERRVVTRAADEEHRTVAVSLSTKLRIAGTIVEDFPECEVVTFSEKGLIQKYELYSDPTPILGLLPAGAGQ